MITFLRRFSLLFGMTDNILWSGTWKSGLASEAVTRDIEQLEQNGQVLRIPHIICNNLVYSSFF